MNINRHELLFYLRLVVLFVFLLSLSACKTGGGEVSKSSNDSPRPQPQTERDSHSKASPLLEYRRFETAEAALRHILDNTRPAIIGFGEFHQQSGTLSVTSAVSRFTNHLLPLLKDRLSDLVVETWISTGRCGESEKRVTKEVDKVSDRPAETEDETILMIRKAAALGIRPHVLKLDCEDYNNLQEDSGVDYLKLLELVGKRLGDKALEVRTARGNESEENNEPPNKCIAIYGGAIHNDAKPDEMWQSVSFGPSMKEAVKEQYVEIDLYVPEFIENSEIAQKEPWFETFKETATNTHAVLIKISEQAYVIVFKRGMKKSR